MLPRSAMYGSSPTILSAYIARPDGADYPDGFAVHKKIKCTRGNAGNATAADRRVAMAANSFAPRLRLRASVPLLRLPGPSSFPRRRPLYWYRPFAVPTRLTKELMGMQRT